MYLNNSLKLINLLVLKINTKKSKIKVNIKNYLIIDLI